MDKDRGVRLLREILGVSPAPTAAFGDDLNDVRMIGAADTSFAVANAHPEIIRRARFVIPSNRDHGVITTLTQLIAESGVSP